MRTVRTCKGRVCLRLWCVVLYLVVGELPPQCAALNRSNIAVQELAVRAALDRDKEAAFHACALDPLTASVAPLDDIRRMFEELWKAEKEFLTYFGKK